MGDKLPNRRSFLKGSLLASLTIATGASVWQLSLSESQAVIEDENYPYKHLDLDARLLLFALLPAYLSPALLLENSSEQKLELLHRVDSAIDFLSVSTQKELTQLFSTLSNQLGRAFLANVWSSWSEADIKATQGFLSSWRTSYLLLMRSGYVGLHQIIFGAFYGFPENWRETGYAGPPSLNLPESFYEQDDQL